MAKQKRGEAFRSAATRNFLWEKPRSANPLHHRIKKFASSRRGGCDLAAMRLLSDTGDQIRILALAGEIDLHFAPVLRALLEEKHEKAAEALVLDLSEVGFIDSTGIAAIIAHLRSAAQFGVKFVIGGMSQAVKEIFEVINLKKAMPVFETREAALQAIRDQRLGDPHEPLFSSKDGDGPPPQTRGP
jgi:anti-anti-sigma factor